MPLEYTAVQSRVKALETLVETLAENLEERIITLEQNPAIQATKAIKQPVAWAFLWASLLVTHGIILSLVLLLMLVL